MNQIKKVASFGLTSLLFANVSGCPLFVQPYLNSEDRTPRHYVFGEVDKIISGRWEGDNSSYFIFDGDGFLHEYGFGNNRFINGETTLHIENDSSYFSTDSATTSLYEYGFEAELSRICSSENSTQQYAATLTGAINTDREMMLDFNAGLEGFCFADLPEEPFIVRKQ